ncbi:MAG: helicase C-terminal domain-containing protein [Candidatus Bathyarchaeota archaeon]|nr:helicase C-terminal domain-containing protein [Candidatus Bathyarchaeota archaeon]MDI9577646.1 helicase C-terminal domain-containing protein [Thermoproteota archaeon]MDT8781417.1 DEAD/DEAH box helicase family protein [Candidatus Bathyarchaeota archaeon]NLD65427.1 DEAD/DEAH box helicase family protein [Thermoproteota archaeon]
MVNLPIEVTEYFPYNSVRPHQDDFITTVNKAVNDRKSVLIEGANGLGKTISALSACLPVAVKKNLKILYVARTHRQHDRVIDELRAIYKRRPITGISIRGRNEMCVNVFAANGAFDSKSLMEVCELLKAKGRCPYYVNVDERTYDYLQLQQQVASRPYMASEILRICKKKEVCPYELVKGAVPDAKVIALSYLYVFDPGIRTAFLKNLETELQKIILVVDEAHNLPETAIDISSSMISLFVLKLAESEANKFGYKDIEAFVRFFRDEVEKLTDKINKEEIISPNQIITIIEKQGNVAKPQAFFEHIHEAGAAIKKALLADGKNPRSYVNAVGEFLLKWLETADDESYINVASKYYTKDNNKTAKLEIVALDPAKITEPVFSSTYANVIMSGTLQPLEAYARINRLPESTVNFLAPSPFPKEHVFSAVCLGVTTSMDKRTSQMYQTMIERVNEVVNSTPTNTGIFAASFQVLNALLSEGLESQLLKPLFYEKSGMTSKANEKLVHDFKACGDKGGAVFLGVQGGRTSEGVDFPGNQMNSVVIVGVPYAEPTPRVKAQINYYENRFSNKGREYGYILPAMKKAAQAAGRPIRTLDDKGAIVFLDLRFATNYSRSFLPSWVTNGMKTLPNQNGILANEIREFFSNQL